MSPEQGKPGQKGSSLDYGVCVWDEEKVLEIALMDTTIFGMYLKALNCMLKNGLNGKLNVVYVLSQ